MNKRGKLITADEAKPAKGQHRSPCSDCPWRRDALNGWLGDTTKEEWVQAAHGEAQIDCHTLIPAQCAGAAIYRANVCKTPRDPSYLTLPSNRDKVFASPKEFLEHHDMTKVAERIRAKKSGG